jgi:hypothetical protein
MGRERESEGYRQSDREGVERTRRGRVIVKGRVLGEKREREREIRWDREGERGRGVRGN